MATLLQEMCAVHPTNSTFLMAMVAVKCAELLSQAVLSALTQALSGVRCATKMRGTHLMGMGHALSVLLGVLLVLHPSAHLVLLVSSSRVLPAVTPNCSNSPMGETLVSPAHRCSLHVNSAHGMIPSSVPHALQSSVGVQNAPVLTYASSVTQTSTFKIVSAGSVMN